MPTVTIETSVVYRNTSPHFSAALIKIGFTQRTQTVPEDNGVGLDIRLLQIPVTASSIATREYEISFKLLSSSTAIVDPFAVTNINFDALFGSRDNAGDPLQEIHLLNAGQNQIPSLRVSIRNDFAIEEEECFTISVSNVGPAPFACNDAATATNYFCSHTICIEDNDGMC